MLTGKNITKIKIDGYSDYKWITKSQFDKFYKNITGDAEVIEKIYKDIIK